MTSHCALAPSSYARLWVTGAVVMLVGAAKRFFRLGLAVLFASCVAASLLGCGATGAHTEAWARASNGTSLFRMCRRHPHVAPNARYWYELGDGTPRTGFQPLEELLESRSVKAVFVYDPYAPSESRKLLGIAFQDLPCDKPPPPPPPPPPPEEIAAKAPEAAPAKRPTVRTLVRREGKRPPDRRFIGQTAPAPEPAPAGHGWNLSPEEVDALQDNRVKECLKGVCHARHQNFRKDWKHRIKLHDGVSKSTGSGSGGAVPPPKPAALPPKPAAKHAPAPQPAPKPAVKTTTKSVSKPNGAAAGQGPATGNGGTTVKTTTKPVSSPNGAAGGKARLPPKGTPERRAIETARDKGVRLKKSQELENIRDGGRGSGVWTDKELAEIRATGKFPDDVNWHHDPTVANRPDLAADPSVVRPVRGGTQGHLQAHGGDFRKP